MLKYWIMAWIVDSVSSNGRLAVWGGKGWIRTDYVGPEASAMLATKWKPKSQPYGYMNKRSAGTCASRLSRTQPVWVKAIAIVLANQRKMEPMDIPASLQGVHGQVCHEGVVPHGGGGDL